MKLLTRDDFRNGVFARDKNTCVVCGSPGQDAHHILERRLWDDGGYYLSNGATLCQACHLKAESTEFSVEFIREKAGITKYVIPPHMYRDLAYDKWGNICLSEGRRLKGELFFDESVQKILSCGPVKPTDFEKYVKYQRTHHLPWSEGHTEDDRVIRDMSAFVGKRVIVTEKMDGENTSMYNDYIHARSLDSRHHESRNWVKQLHGQIGFDIPEGWRLCGENLFAKHSIKYDNLKSYFYAFSIWNEMNQCLSWDESVMWFQMLGVESVPVLYDGIYDEAKIKSLYDNSKRDVSEGYVLRVADTFAYGQFRTHVAKFVRKGHVATHAHWMHQILTKNNLIDN